MLSQHVYWASVSSLTQPNGGRDAQPLSLLPTGMSSGYAASDYDSVESRPDKPLVVKCNYEGISRRITFNSSRTCSFDFLKHRVCTELLLTSWPVDFFFMFQVEESFSLSPASYAITYTDDDGEVTMITTEGDLTEAIRYFHPGTTDDPPLSSAASILSGRSFGRSKITLRVKITIDYDGPSLSDTSSLASTEEYQGRNEDNHSLSLSISSGGSFAGEVEDDARTVSSKDTGSRSRSRYNFFRARGTKTVVPGHCKKPRSARQDDWEEETVSSIQKTLSLSGSSLPSIQDNEESGVFERLKSQEAMENGGDSQGPSPGPSAMQNERYAAWLREQNARTHFVRPRNSSRGDTADELSLADSLSIPGDDAGSIISGELALEKGNGGRFYYTYTSGSSASAPASVDSGFDDNSNGMYDGDSAEPTDGRPLSMDGSWQDVHTQSSSSSSPHHHPSPSHRSYSEPILTREDISPDIPAELLPFITIPVAPPTDPTDCSSCGALLETLRYVCTTCGEKEPVRRTPSKGITINGKGKGRDQDPFGASTATFAYPPSSHRTFESSSWTLVADSGNPFDDSKAIEMKQKPLPALPSSPSSSPSSMTIPGITLHSHSGGSSSTLSSQGPGYELCFNCIESVGVVHALEASIGPESSPLPLDLPPSPEETQRALSEWRRTASRKGHLRHAYLEKVWGPRGWDNVGMCYPRCLVRII